MSNLKSPSFRIPGYAQNAVFQLIIATGVGFIMYQAARVTLIVFGVPGGAAQNKVMPLVALSPVHDFLKHAWTLVTYGWVHNGFMEWISNMVWLFTFGNVVQNLVGFRQVIPTFIYGLLVGGLFCLGVQLIPGLLTPSPFVMSSIAGVMALSAATITLAPKYRFYLGENFSIPLMLVYGIFVILNLLSFSSSLPMIALCIGGQLAGYTMMKLVQNGHQPGSWMYQITGFFSGSLTPDESRLRSNRNRKRQQTLQLSRKKSKTEITQRSVDEILEKIHQRGVNSLTNQEREILEAAANRETQD